MNTPTVVFGDAAASYACFAVSIYLLYLYYFLQQQFLNSFLSEIAKFLSSCQAKEKNLAYMLVISSPFIAMSAISVGGNHTLVMLAACPVIDLVRFLVLARKLLKGGKQTIFPISVGIRNLLLYICCLVLLFLSQANPNEAQRIVLIVLWLVYAIFLCIHEPLVESIIELLYKQDISQRRCTQAVPILAADASEQQDMQDFQSLLRRSQFPQPRASRTFARAFFAVRRGIRKAAAQSLRQRDEDFLRYEVEVQQNEVKLSARQPNDQQDHIDQDEPLQQENNSNRQLLEPEPKSAQRVYEWYQYPAYPVIYVLVKLKEFKTYGSFFKTVVLALFVCCSVFVIVSVDSFVTAAGVNSFFAGVVLGVVLSLQYYSFTERCFQVAEFDLFNTILEEGITRMTLGLGLGLTVGIKETSNGLYSLFYLVEAGLFLAVVVWSAVKNEDLFSVSTGYLFIAVGVIGIACAVVLCWVPFELTF